MKSRIWQLSAVFLFVEIALGAEPVPVTWMVKAPGLPAGARVYLAGNQPELGEWKADGVPLASAPDGAWTGQVSFAPGTRLEYKFTLGAWEREALTDDGVVPANHELEVVGCATAVHIVTRWKEGGRVVQGQITGRVVYHRGMPGFGLPPRDVLVWLPPSYETDTRKRYPVLYMHDAQQIFDPTTSTHGIDWQIDETATQLIEAGEMEEIIVVGTTCTDDRMREYSDTPAGRAYGEFIVRRLKPFIDRRYRTKPDREYTAVMGSSMGGRISFLLAWQYPEVFSMAGCLSSAFWGEMIRNVERAERPAQPLKFYLDSGGIGLERILQPGNDWMLEVLRQKGFEIGRDLIWYQDPKAEHNEAAWARRAWMPLRFMFGKGEQAWIKDLPPVPEPLFAARDREPKTRAELPALTVAGLRRVCRDRDAGAEMAKLAGRTGEFRERLAGMRDPAFEQPIGVSVMTGTNWEETVLAGWVVNRTDGLPDGFEVMELPASDYVKIAHPRALDDLGETFNYVINWWLPRGNLRADGPLVIYPLAGNDANIYVPTAALQ